jgi:hypothetical protein
MGKRIINVINDFFDVGGTDGDVMYSFTGNNACGLTKDNVLSGKTVNLSEMYDTMLDDVREFLFGGEFMNSSDYNTFNNRKNIMYAVNKYTTKKYGISIESVYNKIRCYVAGTTMSLDTLFNELKVKYGMTKMDWVYLYDNVTNFRTNDVEILEYIGNRILNNDIHKYFVTEYNLRTVGVGKTLYSVKYDKFKNYIKLEWDNCKVIRNIRLSEIIKSHSHWWVQMTYASGHTSRHNRDNIKDYDVLLNNRSVTEVFPKYCPVFSNLRMNYTGIDFDGKQNIRKCSEIAGYSDKGETWSLASIDRIDSNKGYSYDNIRIISQYANQLKNVGSIDQMRRLLRYMDEQNSYF